MSLMLPVVGLTYHTTTGDGYDVIGAKCSGNDITV